MASLEHHYVQLPKSSPGETANYSSGRNEKLRSCFLLGALMVYSSLKLIRNPPGMLFNGLFVLEIYEASTYSMLIMGFVILFLSSFADSDRVPGLLLKSIAGIGCFSLFAVFLLRCAIQTPAPSLIRSGIIFLGMVAVLLVAPLLLLNCSKISLSRKRIGQ